MQHRHVSATAFFLKLGQEISASAKERIYAAAERDGDGSDVEAHATSDSVCTLRISCPTCPNMPQYAKRTWRTSRRPLCWGQRAPRARRIAYLLPIRVVVEC